MAGLSVNADVRRLLKGLRGRRRTVTHAEAARFLRGKEFELSHWEENYVMKYGVLLRNGEGSSAAAATTFTKKKNGKTVAWADPGKRSKKGGKGEPMPFFILTLAGRALFLLLLFAMVIAVLTYNILTPKGPEYQRGLSGKAVGARFLFTGAGVLVTFLWGSFFYAVAFLSPYRLFRKERVFKGLAFELNPPSNPFSGLVFSRSKGVRDLFLGIVSATAILSEILPMILGNVSSNGPAAGPVEDVCTWLSIAILSIMIFTVLGSFFVKWPHMSIDPSTMVGAMYYASEYVLSGPNRGYRLHRARRGVV
ncbi:hypothetical protein F4809DRAFT_635733 [Biscogniauxia mediterranea]|nr:hypothetical protein F4809DRAFT_635733 [Biscogniauxia mediterranea]